MSRRKLAGISGPITLHGDDPIRALTRRMKRGDDLRDREWRQLKQGRVPLPRDVQFLGPTIEDARRHAEQIDRIGERSVCLTFNTETGESSFTGDPFTILENGIDGNYETSGAGLDSSVWD
jgi:hypothetical protein